MLMLPTRRQSLWVALGLAAALALCGCSTGFDATPPGAPGTTAWTVERQIVRCRATQHGGTRSAMAGAGGFFVFGSVTAVSRRDGPENCAPILALTDEDVGEMRMLVRAAAASARGAETSWRSRTGARREIVLSVYPADGGRGRTCRSVSAMLTVYGDGSVLPAGALPVVALDEQRLCRTATGTWDPA